VDCRTAGWRGTGRDLLPPLANRRHTVTTMAMARQLNPRRTGSRRSATTRLLAAVGLVALLGGMLLIVMSAGEDNAATPTAVKTAPTKQVRKPVVKPPVAVPIKVVGIGAYDPEGDHSENGGDARLATDGIATTAWKSEHYRSTFGKSGVGLVLDAGKPVRSSRVAVSTETPGYVAQVQAGNSATGPFTSVSRSKTTAARTTFSLEPRRARYLLIWITAMPADGLAAVNEVRVTARG
jgi:hypothetical protein